jgi:hypothetical protein
LTTIVIFQHEMKKDAGRGFIRPVQPWLQ